jgi:hypothetical protein
MASTGRGRGRASWLRTSGDRLRGRIGTVADDLIPILTRFHREVVLPDVTRIVSEVVGSLEGRMNAHFDAIYQRFDKLETEYQMLVAGLKWARNASTGSSRG